MLTALVALSTPSLLMLALQLYRAFNKKCHHSALSYDPYTVVNGTILWSYAICGGAILICSKCKLLVCDVTTLFAKTHIQEAIEALLIL